MDRIKNKWLQHFILLLAPLLTVIDVFVVNIAIPSIKSGLNASDGQIQLAIAGNLLGYASFMITGSRTGDMWGRKKVFIWGMLFFVATSCISGFAQSPQLLIIARFFQGISAAFMTPQALSYMQILFPDAKERTKAIGFMGITLGIAAVSGQFLGGYFSGLHTFMDGWRFIFFINLPVGLLALWATKKYLTETKLNKQGKFDYIGVALLTAALGSLIYTLTEGRESGWPAWSFCMVAFSLFLFYIFIRNQQKALRNGKQPLINMEMFRIRRFSLGILLASIYFMMHTSYFLISTIYIQNGLKVSSLNAGIYFAYSGMFFMLASLLSIRLVNAFGKKPVQFGVLLMILSYILQLEYFTDTVSSSTLIVLLCLTGFSGGLVLPSLINIALKKVPHHFAGAASGVYNTAQQVAASLGICIIAGTFFYILSQTESYLLALRYGLYAEIVCLVLVFVLLGLLNEKQESSTIKTS